MMALPHTSVLHAAAHISRGVVLGATHVATEHSTAPNINTQTRAERDLALT